MSEGVKIGIDPGLSGAVVVLGEAWEVLECFRIPVFKHRSSNRVDGAQLAAQLRKYAGAAQVVIEEVGSMPTDGHMGAFAFGRATGAIIGVVQALGFPVTEVAPAAWKAKAGTQVRKSIEGVRQDATPEDLAAYKARVAKAKRDAKDVSRGRAIELWPTWPELRKSKESGQAYADAALLCRFGGVANA